MKRTETIRAWYVVQEERARVQGGRRAFEQLGIRRRQRSSSAPMTQNYDPGTL
jgi:hypothetical protein